MFWWVGAIRVDSKSDIQEKLLTNGSLEIMEIAFRTKALRTVCLSKEVMNKRYGQREERCSEGDWQTSVRLNALTAYRS
jgi:hypothetical protein